MRMVRTSKEMVLVYQPEVSTTAPALVFESGGGTVSLDHFPDDWRHLSDRELLRLRLRRDD